MFRTDLIFGRNKRNRAFIPTKITPETFYTVKHHGNGRNNSFNKLLYFGTDKIKAEEIKINDLVERIPDPHN